LFSSVGKTVWVAEALMDIVTGGTSTFGTGGMDSKIEAAREAGDYGIPMLLVNGKRKGVIADVAAGGRCTVFIPQ
jgi:glutamate 5-kinase